MNKKHIVLLLISVFLVISCGVRVSIKPDDQERIAANAGYNAAYWPLSNNPDYISKVELPLDMALAAIDSKNVDIVDLVARIVSFAEEFLDQKEFKEYAGPVKQALRSFEGMVSLDVTVAENRERAIMLTRAFLIGAQTAVSDLKAMGV